MIMKETKLYALPTERSSPEKMLSKYSILLYGQEKIGKTTFAAQFPKALFLFFEPGGKDLTVFKEDIRDWHHFRKILTALESDKTYENVIVDTADIAYTMCDRWTCEKYGISDPEDLEFGKGWRKIKQEFAQCAQRLLKCGKGVMFTSHGSEKEYKNKEGDKVGRTMPTMSKQAREILEPMVDIWCYYRYLGSRREFVIRGNESIAAGTRTVNHFQGIDRLDAGRNATEAYSNFLAAFNNSSPKLSTNGGGVEKPKIKFKLK